MPPGIGYAFSPVGDRDRTGVGREGGGASQTPIQDAIRVLSLRIPRVLGARGIAPQALLQAPGAGGLPNGAMGLEQLLMQLFGQQLGQRRDRPVSPESMSPMAPSATRLSPVVPGLVPSAPRMPARAPAPVATASMPPAASVPRIVIGEEAPAMEDEPMAAPRRPAAANRAWPVAAGSWRWPTR